MAWQRDAAKAGAPLSREPLATLKAQLADRIKGIEDLQHRVQVQREAAVLLAQRIEVLSTKSWRDAQAAAEALAGDVPAWQAQAQALLAGSRTGPAWTPSFRRCWRLRAASCRRSGTPSRARWPRPWLPRGSVGAVAARARLGRRTARGPRASRWKRLPSRPSPRSTRKCARRRARSCARSWPSWSRRSRRAMARPARARPRRCAMRSRNMAS